MKEEAGRLVLALEELVRISEEESEGVARARESASAMSDLFRTALEGRLSGKPGDNSGWMERVKSRVSSVGNTVERSKRQELVFVDALECLMHLYAYPEAREGAARVFDLLKQLRLIATSNLLGEEEMPSFELPGGGEADAEEHRRQGLSSVLDWQGRMQERMESRQKMWDDLIARSDEILHEALAVARELARE